MVNVAVSSGDGTDRSARVQLMTASHNLKARASEVPAAEKPQSGKRRTEVVIVGAGDELLIEVGPALGDNYRTFSADTAGEIAGLSVSSWIGVYDATTPGNRPQRLCAARITVWRAPLDRPVCRSGPGQLADVLSRGAACAVISRSEISVAAFAAALAKATQRLAAVAPDAPTSGTSKPRGAMGLDSARSHRGGGRRGMVAEPLSPGCTCRPHRSNTGRPAGSRSGAWPGGRQRNPAGGARQRRGSAVARASCLPRPRRAATQGRCAFARHFCAGVVRRGVGTTAQE